MPSKHPVPAGPVLEGLEPRLLLDAELLSNGGFESGIEPRYDSNYSASADDLGVWLASWAGDIGFVDPAPAAPQPVEGQRVAQVNRAGAEHIYMRMGQIVHAPGVSEVTVRASWFTHYFEADGLITVAFGQQMPASLELAQPHMGFGEYIEVAVMDNQTDAWQSVDQLITLPGTYDYVGIRIDAGDWIDDPAGWSDQYLAVDDVSLLGPADTVAPSAVDDLATVSTSAGSVTLQWTAPGDDGPVGTADRYEVRYSTAGPITEANWDQATLANDVGEPHPSGTTQLGVVAGLQPQTPYWFALRSYDEENNASDVSNSVSATTGVAMANLLTNPGFETGTTGGWQTVGSVQVTPSSALSGSFGLRTDDSGVRQKFTTHPGARYKVTAWLRIDQESGSDWGGFQVKVTDNNWQALGSSGFLTTKNLGTGWAEVGFDFHAISSTSRLHVEYFGGSGRSMTVSVDELMVFEAPATNTPPDIFGVTVTPESTSVGQAQTFEVVADDPDGAIDRYLWEFGDGSRAFTATGSRTVSMPGSFEGTVYVIDDDGAISSRAFTWGAGDPDAPALDVDPTPAETNQQTLTLTGATGGEVTALEISRDNRTLIDVTPGMWSADVPLTPGDNRLLIQATDAAGRLTVIERVVRYVPAEALAVANLTPQASSVEKWKTIELTFDLLGSAASDPHLPYVPDPAEGMDWIDGVTADAVFWLAGRPEETYVRPAFRFQDYDRQRIYESSDEGVEWMQPAGEPVWTVRFAPPEEGVWHCRIEVTEARGSAVSEVATFTASAVTDPDNHGPIVRSGDDDRYFEYADGTPFTVTGHNMAFDIGDYSYHAEDFLNEVGPDNQQLYRIWISGRIWSAPWQYWHSRSLEWGGGNVPPTGLSVEAAYGEGLVACQLDAENQVMHQGWLQPEIAVTPGDTYVVRARWRTEGITGPADPSDPHGLVIKLTGWPEPGTTGDDPVVVDFVTGDTPWHVSEGSFVADEYFLDDHISIILENTTAGRAWVDEVTLHKRLPDGSLGPNVLHDQAFNTHMVFDEARAYSLDQILAEAESLNQHFAIVVGDQEDWILPHMDDHGLPSRVSQSYYGSEGSGKSALHAAYWRYLSARYGSSRAVHSWELVNEGNPGSNDMYRLTSEMARQSADDGNPHLATTSTWSHIHADWWTDPRYEDISYTNLHVYNYNTGWITPKDEIHDDSARYYLEYAAALAAADLGKPSLIGEVGIDPTGGDDDVADDPMLDLDQDGVWLHKFTWAQTASYGPGALYWETDNILGKPLHDIYGAYRRFMEGIPLTNGRYADAGASADDSDLRVVGQKDLATGWAHLWIDNRNDTWWQEVTGGYVAPVSGTVTVDMNAPAGQAFTATWYDTATGLPTGSQTVYADAAGEVDLSVSSLATDTAVRLARVDGEPPTVTSATKDGGQGVPDRLDSLAVQFSEDVDGSIGLRDLEITNLTTGQAVDVSALISREFEYDPSTFVADWDLSFLNLPAGYYRLAIPAVGVTDATGNALDGDGDGVPGGDWSTTAYVAAGGDANLDGLVDVGDLGILAGNWSRNDATWEMADFNGDGLVDVGDLGVLAGGWGIDLTPPAGGEQTAEQTAAMAPRSASMGETVERVSLDSPLTAGTSTPSGADVVAGSSSSVRIEPGPRAWWMSDSVDSAKPDETIDLLGLL